MPQPSTIAIRPFALGDWRALWELRHAQLAEHGIVVPPEAIPEGPELVDRGDHEWDYHHLDSVYCCGAGGFWLAWDGEAPVGHIGAQDLGGVVELRRMYVRPEHRRRGVGSLLVRALLDYCAARGVPAVELWTAADGLGRQLYEKHGFKVVDRPVLDREDFIERTGYTPGDDEVRMRREL